MIQEIPRTLSQRATSSISRKRFPIASTKDSLRPSIPNSIPIWEDAINNTAAFEKPQITGILMKSTKNPSRIIPIIVIRQPLKKVRSTWSVKISQCYCFLLFSNWCKQPQGIQLLHVERAKRFHLIRNNSTCSIISHRKIFVVLDYVRLHEQSHYRCRSYRYILTSAEYQVNEGAHEPSVQSILKNFFKTIQLLEEFHFQFWYINKVKIKAFLNSSSCSWENTYDAMITRKLMRVNWENESVCCSKFENTLHILQ